MSTFLKKLISEESGAGIVEYSLLITFIALVVITAIYAFGESLTETYTNFSSLSIFQGD